MAIRERNSHSEFNLMNNSACAIRTLSLTLAPTLAHVFVMEAGIHFIPFLLSLQCNLYNVQHIHPELSADNFSIKNWTVYDSYDFSIR